MTFRKPINRVLVAIDGSDRSVETVHYLTGVPALLEAKIHLFHVFFQKHESYYRLAEKSAGINASKTLRGWDKQQRLKIESYLEKCRQILLEADFNPGRIETTIRHCRYGIARDIVDESARGYDLVVLRRRGMSSLPALVMGSVALKVFNGIKGVPLVFAGRQPDNHRILIGVDRPDEAMRAVEFVGRMSAGVSPEVGLVSVLRRDLLPLELFLELEGNRVYQDIFDNELTVLFDQLGEKLQTFGIKSEKIDSRIIKNAFSRAGAIVEAADRDNYNTIVIGRRRGPQAKTFFIGRVSNKIIQIGPRQHFWIVN